MKTDFPEKYITLGLKIAYYRRKAGYTQEYLAELIGKSVSFIGQVEGTGTVCGISLETLFKISEVLNVDAEEITMDTTFVDDLGADSLDIFQIIMGIEEEFDIEISNEDAEKIVSVGDAVEEIKNALN